MTFEIIDNVLTEDGTEVESIENLFESHKPHHSTTCTDAQCRMNANFNFF